MGLNASPAPVNFLGIEFQLRRRPHHLQAYIWATLISIVCLVLSWGLQRTFALHNSFLLFLLGVSIVAVLYGTWPSIYASCVSTAMLAYFFMPPIFSLAVSDIQHVFTLIVMATIGIVISGLTTQVLYQAEAARQSAQRFEAFYRLSRDLADMAGSEQLARAAVKHIQDVVGGRAVVLLRDDKRGFRRIPPTPLAEAFRARDWAAAEAAFETGNITGLGTHTSAHSVAIFLPLTAGETPIGVLAAQPAEGLNQYSDDQRQILATLAGQLTGALERDRLTNEVVNAQTEAESERMSAALLSSVSHDLRTPLAAIAGSSSSMLDEDAEISPEQRRELCQAIYENADRLSRIVENLLNMTRLESGKFRVVKQPHVLEEVIGSTLRQMRDELCGRHVETRIPADLPLVPIDDVLFQQVLYNLFDNAVKYDPGGRVLEISARLIGADRLEIEVGDRGRGLKLGEEELVFEKFFRGTDTEGAARGSGLGLTICRAIVAAHGGRITAGNRPGGGAIFRVVLPIAPSPQVVAVNSSHARDEARV
ncbi:MAG: DUF4118 domain-containing protein [Planctomycetaceae bacterium]|nr:DUF4118 domain-containing protein [Planctomycetaceae bacterium]